MVASKTKMVQSFNTGLKAVYVRNLFVWYRPSCATGLEAQGRMGGGDGSRAMEVRPGQGSNFKPNQRVVNFETT